MCAVILFELGFIYILGISVKESVHVIFVAKLNSTGQNH